MLPDGAPGRADCNEQDGGVWLICNYALTPLKCCSHLLLPLGPSVPQANFPLLIQWCCIHSLIAFRFSLILVQRGLIWAVGEKELQNSKATASSCPHQTGPWKQINTLGPPCSLWKPHILLIQERVFSIIFICGNKLQKKDCLKGTCAVAMIPAGGVSHEEVGMSGLWGIQNVI